MPTTVLARFPDPQQLRVEVANAQGAAIALDAAQPIGGGMAATPKEGVLSALAGCTGMDVVSIMRKKRQVATSYEIEVTAASATEHPLVFTRIVVEHRVRGAVAPEALRRAIELSATRYCPVSAMLSASVTIEHRYRLWQDDRPEVSAQVVVTGPPG